MDYDVLIGLQDGKREVNIQRLGYNTYLCILCIG